MGLAASFWFLSTRTPATATCALKRVTGFGALARLDGYPPRVDRASVEFYSHRVVIEIEKSKRLLGYAPRISFEEGMARTEKWLRDENLL